MRCAIESGHMKPPENPPGRGRAPSWLLREDPLLALAFFVLVFLYLWLRVEPPLEYQRSAPAFRTGSAELAPYLSRPGGWVDYAAAGLAQLNRIGWLGALVYTGIGLFSFLATGQLARRLGRPSPLAAYGVVFLLLLLRNRYDAPALAVSLGLLLSLGLGLGFALLPLTRAWMRLAVVWVLAALVFYVAGAWPAWLFIVVSSLFSFRLQRSWKLGLACASAGLIVPCAGLVFPGVSWTTMPLPWGRESSGWVGIAAYSVIALAAVMIVFWPPIPPSTEAVSGRRGAVKNAPVRPGVRLLSRGRVLELSLLVLGWGAVWLGFDRQTKGLAQMDYYAGRGEHQRVLVAASRVVALDSASEVRLHLALYHAGRLGEDLFSFRNQIGWNLMPALSHGGEACRAQSETLLELGQVNLAEHFAHEALEWEGERPDTLRLLARVNVLKDRSRAARIFLKVLGRMPFEAAAAEKILGELETDPRLAGDAVLARVRSRMVTSDLPHNVLPTESVLVQSLQANRGNRMAFEYLMAHYLLTRQTDRLVEGLGRLSDFDYRDIPRHYEEALLLHQKDKSKAEVDLRGRQIRSATRQRFEHFSAALERWAPDSAEGRLALARDFGDTYWYHCVSARATVDSAAEQNREP